MEQDQTPVRSLCLGASVLAGAAAVGLAAGDDDWAGVDGVPHDDHPHSLYKGELGLVLLLADLERPGEARLPLFEPDGDVV